MSDLESQPSVGPEDSDPIELVADQGFVASIALDDWLLVGAPVEVRRLPNQGPWSGRVSSFKKARFSVAEWTLASGEVRSWSFYSDPADGMVKGKQFPISYVGRSWTARVLEDHPAIRVGVSFTIQSGATRRRDFFRRGALALYGKRNPDGSVTAYRPKA